MKGNYYVCWLNLIHMTKITTHEQLLLLKVGDEILQNHEGTEENALRYSIQDNRHNQLFLVTNQIGNLKGFHQIIMPMHMDYDNILDSGFYYLPDQE